MKKSGIVTALALTLSTTFTSHASTGESQDAIEATLGNGPITGT
jgi:hypothetical protein